MSGRGRLRDIRCEFNDGNKAIYHIHTLEPTTQKERDTWVICSENLMDHVEVIQPS